MHGVMQDVFFRSCDAAIRFRLIYLRRAARRKHPSNDASTATVPCCYLYLHRCTALSIGHNISMAAFGGTAPMMATGLLQGTRDIASPSALLTISAALTAAGALLLQRWRIR